MNVAPALHPVPPHPTGTIARADIPRNLDLHLAAGDRAGATDGYATLNRALAYLGPVAAASPASVAVMELDGRFYGFETTYFHEDIGPQPYEHGVTRPSARGVRFMDDALAAVITEAGVVRRTERDA